MDQQQESTQTREESRTTNAGNSLDQVKQLIETLEQRVKEGYQVPLKRDLVVVSRSEMVDLIGQLRIVQPEAVQQAYGVLEQGQQILEKARAEADKMADSAEKIYKETVTQAKEYESRTRGDADQYSEQVRQKALSDANAQIEDAQTRAEQIILAAQKQAQDMIAESEITRRAQAYAMETRERAERDADSIFNQACMQVDKMLSGASVALSRSANELAGLRDNLLGRSGASAQNMQGGAQGAQTMPPFDQKR